MSKAKPRPVRVRVTAADIRSGEAGDCLRCAAALALQRATGDPEANVYERDWAVWIDAHGRTTLAPAEVRKFVWEYDALGRREGGAAVLPGVAPFAFKLPPWPDWLERCGHCEEPFGQAELDDEGLCGECRGENGGGP